MHRKLWNKDFILLLQGNAVKVNGEKVADMNTTYKTADVPAKELLVQSGKKNFKKVIFA